MNILFVDDEEVIRDLFSEIFGEEYELTMAGTAEEALELCMSRPFDLLITDIRLPKMSGLDLIKKVKESGQDLPFIVITGNHDIQISIEALRLGAVDFFLKPFRIEGIRYSLMRFKNLFFNTKELQEKHLIQLKESRFLYKLRPAMNRLNQYINMLMKPLSEISPVRSEDILAIKVSLYELLGNAIEHGCAKIDYDEKKSLMLESMDYFQFVDERLRKSDDFITLEMIYSDGKIQVTIEDPGEGFDIGKVPDPVNDPNASPLSGRGIFLVKLNVDELTFNEKGNRVAFTKHVTLAE